MNVAVIPARGGSKRIPRKNIKQFCGKPIIAYSIELARKSELFDKIIVSTDDKEISEVAKKYGAEIPFVRPSNIADDFTTTDTVFLHALMALSNMDISIQYACCIYPTCPLLEVEDLRTGLNILHSTDLESVISISKYNFPIEHAFRYEKGIMKPIKEELLDMRHQDFEEAYHDAGMFYWVNTNTYLKHRKIFSSLLGGVEIPSIRTQDINTLEDWELASIKYQSRLNAATYEDSD